MIDSQIKEFTGNSKKAKWWFATIYENEWENWKKLLENPKVEFAVWQTEQCPKTDKLHYQAVWKFKNSDRFDWVKKQLPTVHLEHVKSPEAAVKYCQKEDTRVDGPFQKGEWINGNNKRARNAEEFNEAVRSGASLKQLTELDMGRVERNYKGIKFIQSLTRPKSHAGGRTVIVLWGKAGSGKSDYAFRKYPDAYIFPQSASFTHIDGYDGEPVAIIDDITDERGVVGIKFDMLLKLLGDQPYRTNWRGCPCWWNPRLVIITSNYPPSEWYPNIRNQSRGALVRRLQWIIQVGPNTLTRGRERIGLPSLEDIIEYDRRREFAADIIARAWKQRRVGNPHSAEHQQRVGAKNAETQNDAPEVPVDLEAQRARS